jgi:hypothetical protein
MFVPHPSFRFPKGKSIRLWRYLDVPKFLSMLEYRSLFFCRMDKLGDAFESSVPKNMTDMYQAEVERQLGLGTEDGKKIAETLRHNTRAFVWSANVAALCCYANCWHINQRESDAMWAAYLKTPEGVALQSSPARLVSSLSRSPVEIHIGRVEYVDYENANFLNADGTMNTFNYVVKKRLEYQHEKELRAVIWNTPENGAAFSSNPVGAMVPTDLDKLIKRIVVSPNSSRWFHDLIVAIARRYAIRSPVVSSEMARKPIR